MDNELDRYLASLERSSKFKVVRTLKATPHETTELVELTDGISAPGPYIRKRIALNAGIGQAYTRLFQEQQAGHAVDSAPHIYECFETEDTLTVVMEFVQGKTLADWVYETDPSPAFAAYVFPKLCDAVSHLHEGFDPPIIHRDLKPSNVMINDHGVKVIDFGIARTYREAAESDTRHFGTPSYAPPEQFGFGQTDERSDVYALGMLLYYCLTERTPTISMLESEFEDDDVPVPLRKVIAKATAFDPANRYAGVGELKQAFVGAIDEALALEPASASGWAPPSGLPTVLANAGNAGEARYSHCSREDDQASKADHPPQGIFPDDDFTPRKVRVPEVLAIVWNVIVLLAWVLMIIGCLFAAFEPNEPNATSPTWLLVLEYPVCMGAFFTFVAYALLWKKYLRRDLPLLAPFTTKQTCVLCAIGAAACFVAAVVMQAIAQAIS